MHRTTELASQLIDGNLIDDNLLSSETETDNSQIKFIALSNAEKNLSETQQVTLNATSLQTQTYFRSPHPGGEKRRPGIRLCLQARMLLKRGIRNRERTRKWENEKQEPTLALSVTLLPILCVVSRFPFCSSCTLPDSRSVFSVLVTSKVISF